MNLRNLRQNILQLCSVKRISIFIFLFFTAEICFAAVGKMHLQEKFFLLPDDSLKKDSAYSRINSDTAKFIFSSVEIDKKRLVAALLAFPVPFGILGLHRIYLGSEPYIPVVYIFTLGGGCGILPLIDFFEIIFSSDEDFEKFQNNPKVFMWL